MSLLREIQENTCNTTVKLSDVLRKCKILAARLNYDPLKKWIDKELKGYAKEDNLPAYRIFRGIELAGDFINHYGMGKNARISSFSIPEKYRELLTTLYWYQSIAFIESLILKAEAHTLPLFIPQDFLTLLKLEIEELETFISIHRVVSVHQLAFIVDTVKNLVVEFSIEIERENPNAGEAGLGINPIPEPIVSQIFKSCILQNYLIEKNARISANLSNIQAKPGSNFMSEIYQSKYDQSRANIGNNVDTAQDNSRIQSIQHNYNYAPEQKQTLAEVATEIQDLLKQLQVNGFSLDDAQKQVTNDLVNRAQNNPTFKSRLGTWARFLGDAAANALVGEAVVTVLKSVLQLCGISIP